MASLEIELASIEEEGSKSEERLVTMEVALEEPKKGTRLSWMLLNLHAESDMTKHVSRIAMWLRFLLFMLLVNSKNCPRTKA